MENIGIFASAMVDWALCSCSEEKVVSGLEWGLRFRSFEIILNVHNNNTCFFSKNAKILKHIFFFLLLRWGVFDTKNHVRGVAGFASERYLFVLSIWFIGGKYQSIEQIEVRILMKPCIECLILRTWITIEPRYDWSRVVDWCYVEVNQLAVLLMRWEILLY